MRCFRPLLLFAASAAGRAYGPPQGDLRLDLDRPLVTARIGETALRLRVDFLAAGTVELDPDAAARSGLVFRTDAPAEIGPIQLPGRTAEAVMAIAGRPVKLVVSTHDRACCADADGMISPDLLPYRSVTFVRAGGAQRGEITIVAPLESGDDQGLSLRHDTPKGPLLLQIALWRADSVATAAAGARLAALGEGRLEPEIFPTIAPFGVARPSRMLTLAAPVTMSGFRIERLAMRLGDFRGRLSQPTLAARHDDDAILVEGRRKPDQVAWPMIYLGRDQLAGCSTIRYQRAPERLTLSCRPLETGSGQAVAR